MDRVCCPERVESISVFDTQFSSVMAADTMTGQSKMFNFMLPSRN